MLNELYISSGSKNRQYTLRNRFEEETFTPERNVRLRNVHIMNLGADWKKAIEKAEQKAKFFGNNPDLIIPEYFILGAYATPTNRKTYEYQSVLHFGAYEAMSIEEVDPDYLLWLVKSFIMKDENYPINLSSYGYNEMFFEEIKRVAGQELIDTLNKIEIDKQVKIDNEAKELEEKVSKSQIEIAEIGNRIEVSALCTSTYFIDTQYGTSEVIIFKDVNGTLFQKFGNIKAFNFEEGIEYNFSAELKGFYTSTSYSSKGCKFHTITKIKKIK